MIKQMSKEGFWYSEDTPQFPLPVAKDHPERDTALFCTKVRRQQDRASVNYYRGWSTCRLCDKPNGSKEFFVGGWTWPEGYLHYVEDHNVRPSPEFKKFILGE